MFENDTGTGDAIQKTITSLIMTRDLELRSGKNACTTAVSIQKDQLEFRMTVPLRKWNIVLQSTKLN